MQLKELLPNPGTGSPNALLYSLFFGPTLPQPLRSRPLALHSLLRWDVRAE